MPANTDKRAKIQHKAVYTTGEVSRICNISQQTVIRCFDSGKLNGFRVPGSRFRRIPRESLLNFMKEHDIPFDQLDSGKRRVLVVDDDEAIVDMFTELFERDGRFEVDLEFVGEAPSGIRRGQTIRFLLEMSDPAEALLLPKGGFFQSTGGNWVYVLDPSGDFAVKRTISIGRQNTQNYELMTGLEPGDQVVTSSYDTFGDADRLVW